MKVRQHEDESTELVMDSPAPDVMGKFIAGCIRSGLDERVCHECGRPWLTRTPDTLCPVCNPEHVGYNPQGPTDRARWMHFWRSHLTGVLRARAADHQHRRRLLEHGEAIGFTVYPPNATAARLIGQLERASQPRLDESDPEWKKGWERP